MDVRSLETVISSLIDVDRSGNLMGVDQSKNPTKAVKNEVTRSRPVDTVQQDLRATISELQSDAELKRNRISELELKLQELEKQALEAKEARDRAIEQKKEWQLQAASTQSRLEKYRDRFDMMIEKFKVESESRLKSEVQQEVSRLEQGWREQLRKEREIKEGYERLLLSAGFTSGQIASGILPQVANLSGKEGELKEPYNSANGPLLPSASFGPGRSDQFYSLPGDKGPPSPRKSLRPDVPSAIVEPQPPSVPVKTSNPQSVKQTPVPSVPPSHPPTPPPERKSMLSQAKQKVTASFG